MSGTTKAATAAAMKKTDPSRFRPATFQGRPACHGGRLSVLTASRLATRKHTEPR